MNFHNSKFEAAYGTASQLPFSTRPEISFAGRSNVGKSSLLNKLMYRKNLAKTSSSPGKTATINFYNVDDFFLVDLPGYGYAKVSKKEKGRWSNLMEGYFNMPRVFALVVSLIDIRHPATALDIHMLEFLRESNLRYAVVLTKADKLSKQAAQKQMALIKKQVNLPVHVPVLTTSSEDGRGIEDLRSLIEKSIDEYDA